MSIVNRLKITVSPIRLHSASLQIPRSTARFISFLPNVNVSSLKFHSVSSINLYGASSYNIFLNHLRIRLSPFKSPILLKYKNPYKRNSMYPNFSKCNAKLPTVNVSPLKLHSVSSINLYGASNYNIFRNHLRIRLYPIKSPILIKYKNPYKRNSMYSNISKCNAKSCTCCNHLICQSTIISSINHRQFSVVNYSDLD